MLQSDLYWQGQRLDVKLSLGVAKAALYAATKGGRNQTVIADFASDRTGDFGPHARAA